MSTIGKGAQQARKVVEPLPGKVSLVPTEIVFGEGFRIKKH